MKILFALFLAATGWSAPVPAGRLAELLEAPAVRFVMHETPEGRLLSERIPLARKTELRELEARLARVEAGASESALRTFAERELRIDAALGARRISFLGAESAAGKGYESTRGSFLNGAPAARLSVAAVQYPVEGSKTLSQLNVRVEDYVARAKAGGADVVVFPELFMLDLVSNAQWATSEAAQLERIAREDTPLLFEKFRQLSRKYNVAILGGSSPRHTEKGIVNTAILAFPEGRTVLQDKLFLTPDEKVWGWTTGSELQVFDTPWGRSTILICYDSQFPGVSASLGGLAPEVIFVPSMTSPKGFHRVRWAAQARAVEQHSYVVVTGTVGSSDFAAQAAFLTPQEAGFPGTIIQGPKNRDALVFGALDLDKLRRSRATTGLYSGRDTAERGPIKINVQRP